MKPTKASGRSTIPQGAIKPVIDRYIQFEYGRGPSERNSRHATPLIEAAQLNDETSVHLLLMLYALSDATPDIYTEQRETEKTYINAQDMFHKTALHWAAQNHYYSIVQTLLKHGSQVDATGSLGQTPLHLSVLYASKLTSPATLLPEATEVEEISVVERNSPWKRTLTPQLLLDWGATVDKRDTQGRTALYHACREGHKDIAQLLLEKGASIHAKDDHLDTAFHQACWHGHLSVVELLLEYGARDEINSVDGRRRRNPLHLAVFGCHESVVEILIRHGADLNLADAELSTPLHFAAQMGHKSILERLLDAGAEIYVKDRHQRTPLHLASQEGHEEIATYLLALIAWHS